MKREALNGKKHTLALIGEGVIDYKKLVKTMEEEKYSYYVSIEYEEELNIKTDMEEMVLDVRVLSKEEMKKAKEIVKKRKKKAGRQDYVLSCGILKLYEEFKENSFDKVEIHAISTGDFDIATNPFEFYAQFGVDIKKDFLLIPQ